MTVHLTEATTVRAFESIKSRGIGADLVLLDFARGEYFALDEVGAHLWQQIERGATIREMATTVTERYNVDMVVAVRDIISLVTELNARSLVVLESR